MAVTKDLANITGGSLPNSKTTGNGIVKTFTDLETNPINNNLVTSWVDGKPVTFSKTIDVGTSDPTIKPENGQYVYEISKDGTMVDKTNYVPVTPEAPTTSDTSGMEAYQKALASVMSSYQQSEQARLDALQKNYNTALGQLQNSLNTGKDALKRDTDDALRQAYISYMLGQRGINQRLSNSGVNGGATESVLANLYNNYGNNRAAIQNAYQNGLADLVTNYNNNVANLGSTYNTNYADALDDYNKQVATTQNGYASALASMLGKSNATDDTKVTHAVGRSEAINTLSGMTNNPIAAMNYIKNALKDYTEEEIATILPAAGIYDEEAFYNAWQSALGNNTKTPEVTPSVPTENLNSSNVPQAIADAQRYNNFLKSYGMSHANR